MGKVSLFLEAVNLIKKLPGKRKVIAILVLISALAGLYLLCAAGVGSIAYAIPANQIHSRLYWGLAGFGKVVSLFLWGMLVLIILMAMARTNVRNSIRSETYDGKAIAEKGTFGNARYEEDPELERAFTVCNIRDTTENVYGQKITSEHGEEVVAHKKQPKGVIDEQNVLIIGAPGTGKSLAYVRTCIIQAILRGNSVVVNDPKGELYQDMANWAKSKGVKVKLLNLNEPERSDTWDCLSEVISPDTERLDDTRMKAFTQTYYSNASSGNTPNEYWVESPLNVFRALVGCVMWKREIALKAYYLALFKKVAQGSKDFERIFTEIDGNKMISFVYVKEQIRKYALLNGYDLDEINETISEIEDIAPSATIADVFFASYHINEYIHYLKEMPQDHPARLAYQSFQNAGDEQNMGKILQNLQLKMGFFSSRTIRTVLSSKDIDLHQINQEQYAVFVGAPNGTNPLKPISSLFFTFLMTDIRQEYEKANLKVGTEYETNPCRPVSIILDELGTIGAIGGTTDEGIKLLPDTLAISRSSRMEFSIIIQNYGQLQNIYTEHGADTIQNCCNNLLFLGAKDPTTTSFVSSMAGETTAINESHAESQGFFGGTSPVTNQMNMSAARTMLLTPDQIRRIPLGEALLISGRENPVQLKIFKYFDHPVVIQGKKDGTFTPANIYQDHMPISERLTLAEGSRMRLKPDIYMLHENDTEENIYKEDTAKTAAQVADLIANLNPFVMVTEDGEAVESSDLENTEELPVINNEKELNSNKPSNVSQGGQANAETEAKKKAGNSALPDSCSNPSPKRNFSGGTGRNTVTPENSKQSVKPLDSVSKQKPKESQPIQERQAESGKKKKGKAGRRTSTFASNANNRYERNDDRSNESQLDD